MRHDLTINRLAMGAALAAFAASAPAMAADLPIKAPARMVAPAAPVSSWTGFYIGANVGGVWTHTDATWTPLPTPIQFGANVISGPLDDTSIAGGVHGGFNWQFAPSFVAGIEGDWTWTDAKKSFTQTWTFFGTSTPVTGSFTTMSAKLDWLASIRGRLGWLATPDLLLYVTGGGAWGKIDYAANDFNGVTYVTAVAFSNTKSGYAVGGGLEWMFAPQWLLRGEYLHYHLGSASATGAATCCALFPSGYAWNDMNVDEGRVGISYKFF